MSRLSKSPLTGRQDVNKKKIEKGVFKRKNHWRIKNEREEKKGVGGAEVQRRGEEENGRGMLCWRTGRGKPQEGVRGREGSKERQE